MDFIVSVKNFMMLASYIMPLLSLNISPLHQEESNSPIESCKCFV